MPLPFLHRLVRSFLRLIGMSRDQEVLTEFPGLMSVADWKSGLTNSYVQGGDENRQRMDQLRIVEIRHYKESERVQHEFVVAKVVVGVQNPEEHRYVRVDRGAEPPAQSDSPRNNGSLRENIVDKLSSSPNGSSRSLTLSSKSLNAIDRVSTITQWPSVSSHDWVAKLIPLPLEDPPTLVDFANAAWAVREVDNKYQLLHHQCYWYSDLICVVMTESLGMMTETGSRKTKNGFIGADFVYQRKSKDVRIVKEHFERSRLDLTARVQEAQEAAARKEQERQQKEDMRLEERLVPALVATKEAEKREKEEREEKEKARAEAATAAAEAEAERANAKAERAKAEAERAKAEAERAKAEAERVRAEAERAKADSERAKAEAERTKAEAERAKAKEWQSKVRYLEQRLAEKEAGHGQSVDANVK